MNSAPSNRSNNLGSPSPTGPATVGAIGHTARQEDPFQAPPPPAGDDESSPEPTSFLTAKEAEDKLSILSEAMVAQALDQTSLVFSGQYAKGAWDLGQNRFLVNGQPLSGAILGTIGSKFDLNCAPTGSGALQEWKNEPPIGFTVDFKRPVGKSMMASIAYTLDGVQHTYNAFLPLVESREMAPGSIKGHMRITALKGLTDIFKVGGNVLTKELKRIAGGLNVIEQRTEDFGKVNANYRVLTKDALDAGVAVSHSDPGRFEPTFGPLGWRFNHEPSVTVICRTEGRTYSMKWGQLASLPSNTLYEVEVMPVCYETYDGQKGKSLGWTWRLVDVVVHGLVVKVEDVVSPNAGRKRTFDFAKLGAGEPSVARKLFK